MHDQKLTEGEHYRDWWKAELERVRDELDYFTRYYAFVRRGVEDNTKDTNLILGQRGRSNWTSKIPNLFRRSMTGAAERIMNDQVFELTFGKNYVPPTIMRPEFTGYEFMHKKPIDHPYLLPPASGRVEYLVPGGKCYHQSDGTRLTMIWGIWDRMNGEIPSQLLPKPDIRMHMVDLFPSTVRCAFGPSYYDKEKTKRSPCYLCGRIHD